MRLLFLICRNGRQDGGERGGRDEHHGRHGARRGHQAQRPQAEAQEQVRIGQYRIFSNLYLKRHLSMFDGVYKIDAQSLTDF